MIMTKQNVIHTPTNSMDESKDFYQRLKFEMLRENDPTIFTDGKALVEIDPDRYARAGLKVYSDDFSDEVSKLKEITAVLEIEDGFIAGDPNGVRLYLSNKPFEINYELKEESFGLTGNYAGLSIEAHDIDRTVKFWEAAGFLHEEGEISQGYASYSNGTSIGVVLMKPLICPHLFFNPGMTYFNGGKNLTIIGKLREAGIPIAEEITHFNKEGVVDNVIIRDPGGLGFFVFND